MIDIHPKVPIVTANQRVVVYGPRLFQIGHIDSDAARNNAMEEGIP